MEGGTKSSALSVLKDFFKKMGKKKATKAVRNAGLMILMIVVGFFVGRKTMPPVQLPPEIVYLPGEPVEVEKPVPEPYYIKVPADSANIIAECVKSGKFTELFPERVRDSLVYITKEDTAAVVKDWATERFYSEKMFDVDTIGTATMSARVQYNRLYDLNMSFVPVQKNTTINKIVPKKFSPYVGGGITTMPSYAVTAGMYFEDKYGAGLILQRDWERDKTSVGIIATYKF